MGKLEDNKTLENVEFYSEGLDNELSNTKATLKSDESKSIKDYDKDLVDIFPNIDRNTQDKPLLNEEDIVDIIDASQANNIGEQIKPPSSLIKKEDIKAKEVLNPQNFKENLSKNYNLSKDDWHEIASDIENSETLSDEFLDFIELPKISGDRVNFVGRQLISSEYVKSDRKTVEISDNLAQEEEHNTTSIEINRTENGDIESITVYCKCGEVTTIRFDYEEGTNNKIDSEFIQSSSDIEPLNLPNIETK